jgi:hypothetical protein
MFAEHNDRQAGAGSRAGTVSGMADLALVFGIMQIPEMIGSMFIEPTLPAPALETRCDAGPVDHVPKPVEKRMLRSAADAATLGTRAEAEAA